MDGAALGRVLPVAGVLTIRHPVTAAVTLTLLFGACCLRWARSVSSPAAGTSFRTGGGVALGGLIRRRSLLLCTLPSSRPLPTAQPGLNRSRRPNPFLTDDGPLTVAGATAFWSCRASPWLSVSAERLRFPRTASGRPNRSGYFGGFPVSFHNSCIALSSSSKAPSAFASCKAASNSALIFAVTSASDAS